MNRLNFFNPFTRKPHEWEDPLTRAYLIVLRHVPLAQAAFVEAVRSYQRPTVGRSSFGESVVLPSFLSQDLSFEQIETQTGELPADGVSRIYSVAITDEPLSPRAPVQHADRDARYDGVIRYGGNLIVIENKPNAKHLSSAQLNPNVPEERRDAIDPNPILLVWRDLIAALASLQTRDVLAHAERVLIDDFLDYVAVVAHLNPFTRLSVCRGNPYLIRRRLADMLEEIGPGAVGTLAHEKHLKVVGDAMSMVWLRLHGDGETGSVVLELFPADTVKQARAFYDRVDTDALLALTSREATSPGWTSRPYLHFSFMGTHLYWTRRQPPLADYLRFWRSNRDLMGGKARSEDGFYPVFSRLAAAGQIDDVDGLKLKNHFSDTRRGHMNIIPGVKLAYAWPLARAIELDDDRRLAAEVRRQAEQAMLTWGQCLDALASQKISSDVVVA